MKQTYTYNRKESRFPHDGEVIVYTSKGNALQARGRDLSSLGVGIEFPKRLKGYRLGAQVELEFVAPNHLRGVRIKAQLRRVYTNSKGHDQCGFEIIDDNPYVKLKINELVSFYERT